MSVRTLLGGICFIALGLWASAQGNNKTIHLGDVDAKAGGGRFRLDFGGTQTYLANQAFAAFKLHGAYQCVPAIQGHYSFEFKLVGDGLVELQILTGNPRRSRLKKVIRGENTNQALLRAFDEAVLRTTGLPGFFSGKLAYVSRLGQGGPKEMFVADILFRRANRKTNFKGVCCNASWSANGAGILFTSDKARLNNVYFMDFVAGKVRVLAEFKGNNLRGVQSPNGSVAYILSATGNPELWLAPGIGARLRRITRNKSNESGPCWHPDGNRLIVTSDAMGRPQLFEVALPNGALKRIPTNRNRCSEATWNPVDPNRIAFTFAVGGGFQIAEYDFKLRRTRQLTAGAADALQPVWANDGRHIFFTERVRANERLMILDAGTGQGAIPNAALPKPVGLHGKKFGNCSQVSFFYE